VAFTAISLFNMLQMPLNVIPTFVSFKQSSGSYHGYID
jgi:hypothetical protein